VNFFEVSIEKKSLSFFTKGMDTYQIGIVSKGSGRHPQERVNVGQIRDGSFPTATHACFQAYVQTGED